jgi:methyl-accepting chemotaxis protein
VLGAATLLLPALSAWLLARRQAQATGAIQASMEALASGTSKAPQWASGDELGDLSAHMGTVLERFRELPAALQAAAGQLAGTSAIMDSAGGEHRQAMEHQVSALQEAQVTAQEIRQTSALASRRVETVLKVVGRAESLGESGEAALEKTLAGLSAIREFADGISSRVVRVQECAAQIGDITLAVKDLASQSNVLSINAAIEAARSGEHGSGFAVVAQEFRKLTDQSLRETVRIGGILEQVRAAIKELVTMSEHGSKQVEGGLEMVKTSGESLKELSGIIKENAAAARMIAAAVAQQDTGISQVFTAISLLAKGMDEAMQRMETTLEAGHSLETITQQVQEIARRNQVAG